MSITDKWLNEIQARLAVATKGPWTHDDDDDDGVVNGPIYGTYISWESWPEDADFIAHARDDVPDLLAEVHRLKRRVGLLQSENHRLSEALTTCRHREAAARLLPAKMDW